MKYKTSCGIIPIYKDTSNTIRFLLVQGYGNYWGFPKGHKENNETDKQTAERELLEETQLQCDSYVENLVFKERYRIPKKRGIDIIKKVIYFVGIVSDNRVQRQTTELKNHGWFTLEESKNKLIKNRFRMLQRVYNDIT
jgi:bis(5'-nucleosidyl)-tetraphosphatase